MKKIFSTAILFVIVIGGVFAQGQGRIVRSAEEAGLFTDERDGKSYKTAKYTVEYPDKTSHSFTWMMQNLNYKTDGSYCFDDSVSNCEIYGRLYTWDAANKACPQGWHLPSDEEWYHLAFHYGGNCRCGQYLKSDTTLWLREESRGTNEGLFNALPSGSGSRMGTYRGIGWMTLFWSSKERDESSSWDWKLTGGSELQRWHGSKEARNCVRCVKD